MLETVLTEALADDVLLLVEDKGDKEVVEPQWPVVSPWVPREVVVGLVVLATGAFEALLGWTQLVVDFEVTLPDSQSRHPEEPGLTGFNPLTDVVLQGQTE